ncbi:ankyrin repeat domain-containing protein, chloroplastic-like [Ipomoea triloba]|uniref:ankyrin repeat domain-containing protein, chloroplastic-like n=1 Tax=Ipomoea triloba TaxID=35885 RepID=UPI00125E5767|nr:ankyrin repeat domain-containing protein, chloroplastic-like [Ipomoea triloba]
MSALLNLQTPKLYSIFSPSPSSHKLPLPQPQFPSLPLTFTRNTSICLSAPRHSGLVQDEDEEPIIGDCVVFEEGIFDDPYLRPSPRSERGITGQNKKKKKKDSDEVEPEPENLVPEKWTQVQREINITKKEKRRLALEIEFGRRVERRRLLLRPIPDVEKDYSKVVDQKLEQLKPIVLDNPVFPEEEEKSDEEELSGGEEEFSVSNSRVAPRNPRRAVYGGGLDDIRNFFNSESYDPSENKTSEGRRKLFSKEEKLLLNNKFPDLAVATSGKWQPFHTFAASGEFYFTRSLLKHIVDVNLPDKDGLTAIHRAILAKKHAIFNFLLRESANPFIRDKDGATLMHYAVWAASSPMIKILLLYNVDINLQDEYGWTPLHLAVQSRRTDVVRLLLLKGADKTLRNRDGLTPIDLCLHSGRNIRTYELLKLLKQLPNNSKKISAS